MERLEHIGIAVKNLEESNKVFARLLGVEHYKIEEVASEGVRTSFFKLGNVKIELLEATRPDSPIAKFIEKKGEGIHHLAFETKNVNDDLKRYEADGFSLINVAPKAGADNKLIAFLHPKSTHGVLTELCQEISVSSWVFCWALYRIVGYCNSPTLLLLPYNCGPVARMK